MKLLMRGLLAAVVLAATIVCAQTAHADDALANPNPVAAREHLTAGNKLYRLREFGKAIDEYKAGALVEDAPVFHYNLGQCYRQLGKYDDAIWHYKRFLERGKPTGQLRATVEAFLTQMEAERERKAMSQPPVEPAPDAQQPNRVPVDKPKPVTIVVPGEPWYRDTLGWGIAGGGLVATGVGSWLLASAHSLDSDANQEPTQSTRHTLRDRASTRRTAGTIVGVVGAGALVAGLIKLALHPGDQERTVTTSFDVRIGTDGIFVAGQF